MGGLTFCEKVNAWFKISKYYLLILGMQLSSVGMFAIIMVVLNKGMSHYVFVVYRNVIATIALAPISILPFFTWQGSRQAVAVRLSADQCAFYNCRFLGRQVTSHS